MLISVVKFQRKRHGVTTRTSGNPILKSPNKSPARHLVQVLEQIRTSNLHGCQQGSCQKKFTENGASATSFKRYAAGLFKSFVMDLQLSLVFFAFWMAKNNDSLAMAKLRMTVGRKEVPH